MPAPRNPKRSAGLLPYRVSPDGTIEVFIVHPGGPFFAKKDAGVWSVAKGEFEPDESPLDAAEREFQEEVGSPAPRGARIDLGEITQRSGKRAHVFAVEAEGFAPAEIRSNTFEMEWPPRSGRTGRFPEVDRAEWTPEPLARTRLVAGQAAFLDRLAELTGAPPGRVEGVIHEADSDE